MKVHCGVDPSMMATNGGSYFRMQVFGMKETTSEKFKGCLELVDCCYDGEFVGAP